MINMINILMWQYNLITNNNNQKLYIFNGKIKTRCKIFLFLLLILLAATFQQPFSKNKVLFTKYKSKLIRYTMMTIDIQLTLSTVLWIIITVILVRILFKMSTAIIYRHNQLKSLSWIHSSRGFNVGVRSLIHTASAIFRFRLLLSKFSSIILKSMVLTFSCDFFMLWFHTWDVWSLPLWSFIRSVIRRAFLPPNRQYKLVQDISHDKLNHGHVQSQFCF